ncbi:hypothetical protein DL766_002992 [Monosporascus sp. MC13-8B]|uniref:Uncharacterized protein n=1 Tax=Monosporascus cannonballus TaxID=155416 RepID=A0ABY0HID4_9PEZI|nr:hypothetical protein DL762_000958 [Monosporascus cannonballus]RYP34471.1 hypothetical protein DL766_002992 [Monosporascus sp. MC13-8B]
MILNGRGVSLRNHGWGKAARRLVNELTGPIMKLSFPSGVLLAQASLWLSPRSVDAASVDAWLVPELAAPQVVVTGIVGSGYTSNDRVVVGVDGLPPIQQPSSLDVLPVGATAGQRIYFRDETGQPAILGYHLDLEKWQFDGYILQGNLSGSSGSLGAAILGTRYITMAFAVDRVIGVSQLRGSEWDLSEPPRRRQPGLGV